MTMTPIMITTAMIIAVAIASKFMVMNMVMATLAMSFESDA